MKTDMSILDHYFKTLEPQLKKLELQRKKTLSLISVITFVLTPLLLWFLHLFIPEATLLYLFSILIKAFLIISLILVLNRTKLPPFLKLSFYALITMILLFFLEERVVFQIVFVITGLIIIYFIVNFFLIDYHRAFQKRIMAPLIEAIYPSFHYAPDGYVMHNHLQRSKLISIRPDLVHGKDKIYGKKDGVTFELSYIIAQVMQKEGVAAVNPARSIGALVDFFFRILFDTNDPLSKNITDDIKTYVPVFSGFLFAATFNKSFKYPLFINPESPGSLPDVKRIRLDNLHFEKKFHTYGSDPIEAHYLLTFSMMERLLKLQDTLPDKLSISLVGSQIYILFNYPEELTVPSVLTTLYRKETLNYIAMLHSLLHIISELGLNEYIWSKSQ